MNNVDSHSTEWDFLYLWTLGYWDCTVFTRNHLNSWLPHGESFPTQANRERRTEKLSFFIALHVLKKPKIIYGTVNDAEHTSFTGIPKNASQFY